MAQPLPPPPPLPAELARESPERVAAEAVFAEGVTDLETFSITLTGPERVLSGAARDVLDGPLHAVRFLLNEIARTGADPIAAGEVVSTGTLTDAVPVARGETWATELRGVGLPGMSVAFV